MLLLTLWLPAGRAAAREPWSDGRLPHLEGLQFWFDATTLSGQLGLQPQAGVKEWPDGSGNGRHLIQAEPDWQPTLIRAVDTWLVRFDGLDDYLGLPGLSAEWDDATVILVANVYANPGGFRALLAANREGTNDYVSGFNVDQGHAGSAVLQTVNVEGVGFGGQRNLLAGARDFGMPQVLSVVSHEGAGGVQLYVNGERSGDRDRQAGKLAIHRLTVGARYYNNAGPPDVRGFLEGEVAELLIFDRALSGAERQSVELYLQGKYRNWLGTRWDRPASRAGGHRLVAVPAPSVQVFLPGFEVQELPLALPNLNNLRYREDGTLIAAGYNGNIYVLSDTDGDGLEDRSDLFWDSRGRTQAPIGMALTPPGYRHGRGVFLPVIGKLSLIVDDDGDDRGDREIVVAQGWKPLQHQVDTFGVAVDPRDQSIVFGLGTEQFTNAYLVDAGGQAHYDRRSERGTIQRVAADFQSRSAECSGIRFSVALAFNRHGDLFATDQEGATWLANGNPFDELLHIQPGRHYGFPPRHPQYLPDVIDEPSTFDYSPQHQSTCGLQFNDPVAGGPVFGPGWWDGDALVAGYARGKLYRTKLVRTAAGYVADNQLIASFNSLVVDATSTPRGDLMVATHSGGPDWGTGPGGAGKLYRITYAHPELPQPVLVWPQGPYDTRVAFDRPVTSEFLTRLLDRIRIEWGAAVAAGDRFEVHRPGYEVVQQQLLQPRHELPIHAVQVTPDRRTVVISTGEQAAAAGYALTIFGDAEVAATVKSGEESRIRALLDPAEASAVSRRTAADIDLAYSLYGVQANWQSADGPRTWVGWLPHFDTQVARELTRHSAQHDEFWSLVRQPGRLKLSTRINAHSMLRPAIQPGSAIGYTWPAEQTSVEWRSNRPLTVSAATGETTGNVERWRWVSSADQVDPVPLELELETGGDFELRVDWRTNEDERPRPLSRDRLLVPWSRADRPTATSIARREIAELRGGSWSRGRLAFFDRQVGCAKCHSVGGQGAQLGPDLTNVVHRDYQSVLRDILEPGFAINPEFITHAVVLADGRTLSGVTRQDGTRLLIGNDRGEVTAVEQADVESLQALAISTMPVGLPQTLGPERLRDLLTFLLTPPPRMPDYGPSPPPPPRTRAELAGLVSGAPEPPAKYPSLRIVLVAGPKDHGPGEHDYPAWVASWSELLRCAEHVEVETAERWPSREQLNTANVLVFYQQGEWNAARARDLDAFQARGGGAVYLHYAVDGGADPNGFATRIGLAWQGGRSKFRHGPLELHFPRSSLHPIARNFARVKFVDESYWGLVGDTSRLQLLATGVEDDAPQPLFWTVEHPPDSSTAPSARVLVSILGHYAWTFDDPLFRLLVLRGIAWTGHQPVDRFNGIVTLGARLE